MHSATWSRARGPRWAHAVLAAALVFFAAAGARAEPPAATPADSPPAEAAPPPPATPAPPPPATPAAPPPALPAPPPAAAAPEAMPPTLTPDLPAVPPPALEVGPPSPPPPGKPFYRKSWFWGAVGVVVLTAAIVLIATTGSEDQAPSTTLGNMRAF